MNPYLFLSWCSVLLKHSSFVEKIHSHLQTYVYKLAKQFQQMVALSYADFIEPKLK